MSEEAVKGLDIKFRDGPKRTGIPITPGSCFEDVICDGKKFSYNEFADFVNDLHSKLIKAQGKVSKRIEYREFKVTELYEDEFDDIEGLNGLGKKGWVLIGELRSVVYGTGDIDHIGIFWREVKCPMNLKSTI